MHPPLGPQASRRKTSTSREKKGRFRPGGKKKVARVHVRLQSLVRNREEREFLSLEPERSDYQLLGWVGRKREGRGKKKFFQNLNTRTFLFEGHYDRRDKGKESRKPFPNGGRKKRGGTTSARRADEIEKRVFNPSIQKKRGEILALLLSTKKEKKVSASIN